MPAVTDYKIRRVMLKLKTLMEGCKWMQFALLRVSPEERQEEALARFDALDKKLLDVLEEVEDRIEEMLSDDNFRCNG